MMEHLCSYFPGPRSIRTIFRGVPSPCADAGDEPAADGKGGDADAG